MENSEEVVLEKIKKKGVCMQKVRKAFDFIAPSLEAFMYGVAMVAWLAIFYPLSHKTGNTGTIAMMIVGLALMARRCQPDRGMATIISPLLCWSVGGLVVFFFPGLILFIVS